jgi:serine phosphatase RsbU (regulator of sigma subunit)
VFKEAENIGQYFPESFMFERIKKNITGDFLYIRKENDCYYLALIDCTSVGVPAAFMSIVGHDFINEIISNADNGVLPSKILKALHFKMLDALNPEKNEELNDGLDVALLKIDKVNRKIVFAGARRPMIAIQNKQLETYKGSFSSVGIYYSGVETEYNDVEIDIDESTIIYLFSDGFANQFDETGKKYKISTFRKLLKEIHQKPMAAQATIIEEEFDKWKGEAEQIDDVIVAGVKIYGQLIPKVNAES